MGRPVVAIVGRQNVGKSTLFNRIVGHRQAVVDDLPGVTRDRNDAVAEWAGVEFRIIDTGGLIPEARTGLDASVRRQVETAVATADLVLLVVDVEVGVMPIDRQIGDVVRRSDRAYLLLANKTDSERREVDALEFSRLGLGEAIPVSALHGYAMGDLLDRVVAALPTESGLIDTSDGVRVAVVGRPNVGKSSLVNQLLGEERMIVDDVAGTTRDAVDSVFEWEGNRLVLVDTAGLRRRTSIDTRTEYYCTVRAMKALDRCDVAIQVLDTAQEFSRQDYRISQAVLEAARPTVLAFNKWDLVGEKETLTSKHREEDYREHVNDLWYAPAVFISALTGQRVSRLPSMIMAGYKEARRRFGSARIMTAVEDAVRQVAPPAARQRHLLFLRAKQVTVNPIRFAIDTSQPESVPPSYQRYLRRRLRQALGIEYAPLLLDFRRPPRRKRRRREVAGDSEE